jgi:ATPase family associated with various cellular activities (AAA)
MLAILLRGIGWKSGVERAVGADDVARGLESHDSGKPAQGATEKEKGAAWGGGGGIGGLLVHGPSGCGKTHLVHALAKWCSTSSELSPSERPYLHPPLHFFPLSTKKLGHMADTFVQYHVELLQAVRTTRS